MTSSFIGRPKSQLFEDYSINRDPNLQAMRVSESAGPRLDRFYGGLVELHVILRD